MIKSCAQLIWCKRYKNASLYQVSFLLSEQERDSRAKFCSVIGQTTSLPSVRKDLYIRMIRYAAMEDVGEAYLGEPTKQTANLSTFSASDFLDFLEQKVESVRSDTAGSAPPSFSSTTCTFASFSLCSQELVGKVNGGAASKSCELDPALTFLIKEFLEILLPFLTRLCNASFQEGHLPSSQTTAIVTPTLKKPSLDPSDMKNYRPISNLSFMS